MAEITRVDGTIQLDDGREMPFVVAIPSAEPDQWGQTFAALCSLALTTPAGSLTTFPADGSASPHRVARAMVIAGARRIAEFYGRPMAAFTDVPLAYQVLTAAGLDPEDADV